MGGTLTNNATIKKSIKKMQDIDAIVNSENNKLKKKEIAVLSRQGEKLHRDLDGIASMKKLPDAVVIVDVCHDEIAVKEARKLNIPIVAIVDTNGDPEPIDYPIAANDDAVKSIKVIMDTFVETIKDAAELYGKKAAEDKAKAEAAAAERAKDEPKRRSAKGEGRDGKGGKRAFTKRPSRKPVDGAPKAEGEEKVEVTTDAEMKKKAPAKKAAPKKAEAAAEAPKAEEKPAE